MDRMSLLPDDLILKILSLVPSKLAVTTSLLSKRWYSLWKHVPRLEYRDPSSDSEYWRASRFVDKFLLLHNEAPVLKTLHLSVSRNCPPTDIATWIQIAVSRGVCKLHLSHLGPCDTPLRLPRSLFTCQTLVALRLHQASIVDVPATICFRSLKVLYFVSVSFSSDEIVHRLLSGCPVLIELGLGACSYGNVKTFSMELPSLRSLILGELSTGSQAPGDDDGFVIKAPSLRSLKIFNDFRWVCSLVDMPYLVKVNVSLRDADSKRLIGCLTSARHLSLCAKPPTDSYPTRIFSQLVSLRLCTCSLSWFRLILRKTPKLRVLRFLRCCRSSVGATAFCSSMFEIESRNC